VFEEVLLQAKKLLVDQVISLVDEAEGDVGHDLRRASFYKLTVVFIGLGCFAPQLADVLCFLGVLVPDRKITRTELVFVVVEQFLQAGAGHIGQLDFHFLGSESGLAALQDIPILHISSHSGQDKVSPSDANLDLAFPHPSWVRVYRTIGARHARPSLHIKFPAVQWTKDPSIFEHARA